MSYTHRRVPVEVEVEGLDLNPQRACELLSTCLHEVDTWLDRILLEKEGNHGDVH